MNRPSMDEMLKWKRLAEAGDFESLLDCDTPVLRLLSVIMEYENAITWDTTCLNCSNLLNQLYDSDMRIERVQATIRGLLERKDLIAPSEVAEWLEEDLKR